MIVRTLTETANTIDRGLRLLFDLQELAPAERQRVQALFEAYRQAHERYADSRTLGQAVDRLAHLLDLTNDLHNRIHIAGEIIALEERLRDETSAFQAAVRDVAKIASIPFESNELPPELAKRLGALSGRELKLGGVTQLLLDTVAPLDRNARRLILARISRARLVDLHATVLTSILAASPDEPRFKGDVRELRQDVEARASTLRDDARGAIRLLSGTAAPPAVSILLALAVQRWEQWVLTEAHQAIADALAAARRRLLDGASDSFAWGRDAGRAYDALRLGLAWNAGAREILLALAFRDTPQLARVRAAGALQLASAQLDLPRTPIRALSDVEDGSAVEIEGIVTTAAFRPGGPAPRSVLTLKADDSASVQVLVPFTSVDSFGVVPGVWAQVRGTFMSSGKDDLIGPLVQVGRIRGLETAEQSFSDFLVASGRRLFELRPGQLDLAAGRVAGDVSVLSEIKVRPGAPEVQP